MKYSSDGRIIRKPQQTAQILRVIYDRNFITKKRRQYFITMLDLMRLSGGFKLSAKYLADIKKNLFKEYLAMHPIDSVFMIADICELSSVRLIGPGLISDYLPNIFYMHPVIDGNEVRDGFMREVSERTAKETSEIIVSIYEKNFITQKRRQCSITWLDMKNISKKLELKVQFLADIKKLLFQKNIAMHQIDNIFLFADISDFSSIRPISAKEICLYTQEIDCDDHNRVYDTDNDNAYANLYDEE